MTAGKYIDIVMLGFIMSGTSGEMAEWSIALPWKGSIRKRIKGSNPFFSAILMIWLVAQ